MIRLLCIVAVMVMLAGGVPRSSAQSPSTASSSQGLLEEAAQLNQDAFRFYGEGKYREAVAPAERALALRERALGPNHPDVAESLNTLAELYRVQGVYAKAEPLVARALDISKKALGPNHPLVATSLNNLAALYKAQGAYAKAELLLARALDIRERALGPNHPDVATSLNNLAVLYQHQGAYANVATGERGYQIHRDHRDPGTHPVARGRFFALTAAPQGADGVASQRETNRGGACRSVRHQESVRWNASLVDSPFRHR